MGNIAFLEHYGQQHDIQVRSISLEEAQQGRISSTRIRTLVSEGQITAANELLGHPMVVSGIVQHGEERGRLLGFPTANLRPEAQKLLPANGVYAVRAYVQKGLESDPAGDSPVYNGVVNIGVRPTFDGKERLVEVHLLDVTLDLYGKYLAAEFIENLRQEQRFTDIEALKTQIAADVQRAYHILTSRSVSN
jgi:riboflavin kinase/FMN adenylyltransferase